MIITRFLVLDGRVPEDCGLGGVGWRAVFFAPVGLFPAGQDGHAVLFAQSFVWFLPCLDLVAKMPFLFDHLHHGVVPACPWHRGHLGGVKECWCHLYPYVCFLTICICSFSLYPAVNLNDVI